MDGQSDPHMPDNRSKKDSLFPKANAIGVILTGPGGWSRVKLKAGVSRFAETVGQVLREARQERGFTLREACESSEGWFKPAVIGGYERGYRSVSLVRFSLLARLYGVPPDRLLARAVERLEPEARQRTVLDLGRLESIDGDVGDAVMGFVQRVKWERGDPAKDVITLRAGDLEAMAMDSGLTVDRLVEALEPALEG